MNDGPEPRISHIDQYTNHIFTHPLLWGVKDTYRGPWSWTHNISGCPSHVEHCRYLGSVGQLPHRLQANCEFMYNSVHQSCLEKVDYILLGCSRKVYMFL